MTFKHTKFGDSATMRSLERVAQAKGWLQEDPHLVKTAAKAVDLTPSDSLMENIVKLCGALRTAGFDKHADGIEESFVQFKQADQNYDVSGEDGEDLIHAAHPEGGHQMEDVEGDAYIEDILEKHLKMVDVAEGEPKAKLSNAKSVLDAVKVALGAPPLGFQEVNLPSAPSAYGRLMSLLGKSPKLELAGEGAEAAAGAGAGVGAGAVAAGGAAVLAGAIAGGVVGNALFEHYYEATDLVEAGQKVLSEAKDVESDLSPQAFTYVNQFTNLLGQIKGNYSAVAETQKSPTPENLAVLKSLNDAIYQSRRVVGSLWSFSEGKKDDQFLGALRGFGDVVAAAQNYMNVAAKINAVIDQFFAQAVQFMQQKTQQTKKEEATSVGGTEGQSLIQDYASVLQDISRYNAVLDAKKPANAVQLKTWLARASKIIATQQAAFNKVDNANKPAVTKIYADKLNDIKQKLSAFNNRWMNS